MLNTFQLLKDKRISQNIAVQDIVNQLGYSKSTIYRYEKNEFETISVEMLVNIGYFLNINIEELIESLRMDGYTDSYTLNVRTLYAQNNHPPYEHKNPIQDHESMTLALSQLSEYCNHIGANLELYDLLVNLDEDQTKRALTILKATFPDQ